MGTKLTLRIDECLIKKAKAYSARRGKSLSSMVADFFRLLPVEGKGGKRADLPPKVSSLKGILKGKDLGRDDYRRYLEERYL